MYSNVRTAIVRTFLVRPLSQASVTAVPALEQRSHALTGAMRSLPRAHDNCPRTRHAAAAAEPESAVRSPVRSRSSTSGRRRTACWAIAPCGGPGTVRDMVMYRLTASERPEIKEHPPSRQDKPLRRRGQRPMFARMSAPCDFVRSSGAGAAFPASVVGRNKDVSGTTQNIA